MICLRSWYNFTAMCMLFRKHKQQQSAERSIEALKVGLAIVELDPQWDAEQIYRRGAETAAAGDYKLSAIYFYKAATTGYAAAQHYLGWCFEVGRGVDCCHSEAVKWYRLAAEQGFAYAQCTLAICYHKGRGVKKNYDLAAGWYAAAAVQGVARAQFELAGLYAEGKGVETSAEESVRWYIAAARQGHKMSRELLKSFKVEY